MRPRFLSSLILVTVATGVAACRGKQPPPPAPQAPPQPPPTVITENPRPPITVPTTNNRPTGPSAAEVAAAIETMKNTLTQTIFFDYDKSDLRDDARAVLDSKVPLLQRFPQVRIRIMGHTDERGSLEYNIALGQRRAAAAQKYLESRGIAAGRMDVVSFGEERTSVGGEGEQSWSRNRRDEFAIVAGADQIRPATN